MPKTLYPEQPVLLVDDEPAWLHSFSLALRAAGITGIVTCDDPRRVLGLLEERPFSALVLDLIMPGIDGRELLQEIIATRSWLPVIILTALDQVETAVECMKLGAYDYYTKVTEQDRLIAGVRRAVELGRLRHENRLLKESLLADGPKNRQAFAAIITHSPAMLNIFRYIEAIAGTGEPVLISGETGVGKELVARALHALSNRPGEMVCVNAAGLDDVMFADTLFGHVKGAFTGAHQPRGGLVEKAADGTLFLDEIGDLSPASQLKLLRLIQEREYLPLGSDIARKTNTRIVVATHHDLKQAVAAGTFRRDLYYRLLTHHVHIPPLRERREDIEPLFVHFLAEAAKSLGKKIPAWPPELITLLQTYSFPGNVRELRNLVFDALSRHVSHTLSTASFREHILGENQEEPQPPDTADTPFSSLLTLPTLKEAGNLLVLEALRRSNGNQTIAAAMLGITRQALAWRLKPMEDNG